MTREQLLAIIDELIEQEDEARSLRNMYAAVADVEPNLERANYYAGKAVGLYTAVSLLNNTIIDNGRED